MKNSMPPQWLKRKNAKYKINKQNNKPTPPPFVPDWITDHNTVAYFVVKPLEELLTGNAFFLGVYKEKSRQGPYAMIPPGLFIELTERQDGGNTFEADPYKLRNVHRVIDERRRFSELPFLVVKPASWNKNNWTATSDDVIAMLKDPATEIHNHEGRHRAHALRSMGVPTMPVHVMFKRSFIDMCASGAVM